MYFYHLFKNHSILHNQSKTTQTKICLYINRFFFVYTKCTSKLLFGIVRKHGMPSIYDL